MLLLRVVLLELLVCAHVLGAAVLFRRVFPRESPWLAFIVPILFVMTACNFIEHFIALTSLGWLLPFTLGGLAWIALRPESTCGGWLRPGYSWDGLVFPSVIFLGVFTWAFFFKCMNPEITCNTEGVADMARIVDFCLGDKLPPTDSWCPPYDHGGYYTFQHYGASLLKRLFSLDIGTGYNMSYNLLNTLTVMVGVGAAYALSGNRKWVALLTLLVLLADFTGAGVLLLIWNTFHHDPSVNIFDSRLAIDIGDGWNDPGRHNPFGWIFKQDPPALRLFTPTFNIYFPEFHANLSGHFFTLATLLAANEANKEERSNLPWIGLLVFPLMTIIAATWFFVVVTVLCAGSFLALLLAGKRPQSLFFVVAGTLLTAVCLWPSVDSLLSGSYPANFRWTPWDQYTRPWEFIIQWWPIVLPWACLFFVWRRMSWLARWIHVALPLLLIFVEVATFGDRGLTAEKMWGAIYGAGLVTFLPIVYLQRGVIFRGLTILYLVIAVIFIASWATICTTGVDYETVAFRLKGDTVFQNDGQKRRLLQTLKQLHGVTILPGKSTWAYNQAPSLIGFAEDRCYIAWFFQEYQCGHAGEAEFRNDVNNNFYDEKLPNPLAFLRSNHIAAVLIWPEDAIPDDRLARLKDELAADYYYVDCRLGGEHNAGLFMPVSGTPAAEAARAAP